MCPRVHVYASKLWVPVLQSQMMLCGEHWELPKHVGGVGIPATDLEYDIQWKLLRI